MIVASGDAMLACTPLLFETHLVESGYEMTILPGEPEEYHRSFNREGEIFELYSLDPYRPLVDLLLLPVGWVH